MDTLSVNQYRDNPTSYVEPIVSRHKPLKVTRRAGEAFVVMSADDWEQEKETLHVLEIRHLIQPIAGALETTPEDKAINRLTSQWSGSLVFEDNPRSGVRGHARRGQTVT